MKRHTKKCRAASLFACLIITMGLTTVGDLAQAEKTMTPKQVVSMTKEVVDLVGAKGKDAFPQLRSGDFTFGETYPIICDLKGKVLLHAVIPRYEGKSLMAMRDMNGKFIVAEIISLARDKDSGWVEIAWPKPGQKMASQKVLYFRKGKCENKDVLCLVGIYDVSKEDCERQAGN